MHVVINSHLVAHARSFPIVSNAVSVPLNFEKDKSHKVFGISQTGNELDSGEKFCINDILDEKFLVLGKVVDWSIINECTIVIHVLIICFSYSCHDF